MCQLSETPPATEEQPPAHQAGKCPSCQCDELAYGDSGIQDGGYAYDWTCVECGATGTEWFDLVFSQHIIKTPGDAE